MASNPPCFGSLKAVTYRNRELPSIITYILACITTATLVLAARLSAQSDRFSAIVDEWVQLVEIPPISVRKSGLVDQKNCPDRKISPSASVFGWLPYRIMLAVPAGIHNCCRKTSESTAFAGPVAPLVGLIRSTAAGMPDLLTTQLLAFSNRVVNPGMLHGKRKGKVLPLSRPDRRPTLLRGGTST